MSIYPNTLFFCNKKYYNPAVCSMVLFFSHCFFIQADELRAVALEEQINFSGGAVAMLGDDQLRGMERFLPGVFVIVLPKKQAGQPDGGDRGAELQHRRHARQVAKK